MPLSRPPPPSTAGALASLDHQLHAFAHDPQHGLVEGLRVLKNAMAGNNQDRPPDDQSVNQQQQQQQQLESTNGLNCLGIQYHSDCSRVRSDRGSNSKSSSPAHQHHRQLSNGHSTNGHQQQQSSPGQQQQQVMNGNGPKPKTVVVTPDIVMKLYMNKLTPYEHHEIFTYKQIYFIGASAKKRPGIIGMPNNNDYDNDKGSYIHIMHDHVAYRYEVIRVIGRGSFGQVVKAYDHKRHEHVALKMVRNEERFHRQAQEEVRILRKLKDQDKDNNMNIIHMFDSFTFRNHMCITFELLSINLYELIKRNKFQGFSLQLVRKFSHSLLQCLEALHKNKIIHCDMKPENVLLKQQGRSGIKVIYMNYQNICNSFH